jgi:hypothetical protein
MLVGYGGVRHSLAARDVAIYALWLEAWGASQNDLVFAEIS